MDKDFDDMSMCEQQQFILDHVLSELGLDSIAIDSTAFENPQVKESECK